ncbi:MAG: CvpA family protein [Deltaproteobacteria bacterium]|jgi:membrane protein required for colicin V production|nr:CvpA family protein [Deltaproteobacteria bacterium]
MEFNLTEYANALDLILAGLVLFMLIRGAARGVMAELAGLAALLLGFIAASNAGLHSLVAEKLSAFTGELFWSDVLARVLLFLLVSFLSLTLFNLLSRLFTAKAPGWLDRLLGALAGLAKGVLLCSFLLVFIHYLAPHSQLRLNSRLSPRINELWAGIENLTGGLQSFPSLYIKDRQR